MHKECLCIMFYKSYRFTRALQAPVQFPHQRRARATSQEAAAPPLPCRSLLLFPFFVPSSAAAAAALHTPLCCSYERWNI
ncbi:hypothetical protein BS78_05G278400 [Paspalum vaginatum]|nr:hypothetical protein BS78_05G278400 [Paspalum vaginatum]